MKQHEQYGMTLIHFLPERKQVGNLKRPLLSITYKKREEVELLAVMKNM